MIAFQPQRNDVIIFLLMSRVRLFVLINAIKHYISVEKLELAYMYTRLYIQLRSDCICSHGNYLVIVPGMLFPSYIGDEVQRRQSCKMLFLIASNRWEFHLQKVSTFNGFKDDITDANRR